MSCLANFENDAVVVGKR